MKSAYNVINPEPIIARDYFEEIARQLGVSLTVKNKSIRAIWKEQEGWELTTLPHLYDASDLKKAIGYVPDTPLSVAIKGAIQSYPTYTDIKKIPVHRKMTQLPRPLPIRWVLNRSSR